MRRVLVRAPNWLGDAVMCEPALRAVKRLWPDATVSLLAKPAVAELFMHHPALNAILSYQDKGRHGGWLGKWTLVGELRRTGYDAALLFQNAFEAALLAFGAGIPRRIGYATDGRSLLLTDPVAVPDRQKSVHQVQYYWNVLKPFGLDGEPTQPALVLSAEEEQAMAARLEQSGIWRTDVTIGINPGSTYGGAKRWLPDRFAETANRLSRKLEEESGQRAAVVIVGAKGEEGLGREIAARLTGRSVVLSGATTIRELMAAIKRCALLLTNDTGPMHVASAFQVPIVAVFGPTDWRTTSPAGTAHTIVRQPVDCAPCLLRECPIDHRCMTGVSVDRVYHAAVEQLRDLSSLSGLSGREGIAHQTDRTDQRDRTGRIDILRGVTVFLDRDGTLNYDPGYLKSPAEVRLLPGVGPALARLKAAGARLVVVTNQSGVGRGLLTLKDLEAIHDRLQGLLAAEDAVVDAIYFCPHHPDDGCRCRKPSTAMVERAASELQLDLTKSYLIGDHARDIQLAKRIGAKSVLLVAEPVEGHNLEALRNEGAVPDAFARSMAEAAEWVLAEAATSAKSRDERERRERQKL